MNKISKLALASLLAWQAVSPMAQAEEVTGRLQRIQQHKTMVLGYYETGMPFSYLDNSGQQGFGVELSLRIADAVKAHLKLDHLDIRWNAMTFTSRMSLMKANAMDMECSATSHEKDREAIVSFSNSFFISSRAFAARTEAGIKSASDLAGKRIVAVRGSKHEQYAASLGGQLNLVENNQRAMAALTQGEADAYVSNTGLLAREMLRMKDASPYSVTGVASDESAYACMLPKGDAQLKKIADDTIAQMQTSGEMAKLYTKWFSNPIPPYGRSARLTLNDLNKNLYKNPNDRPLD